MKSQSDGWDKLFDRSYFFDDGIFFNCRQCGCCCTGSPGVVRVNEHEIKRISQYLSLPLAQFKSEYLIPFGDGFSIREDQQCRCLFYENGCAIYPVRPSQCKTYPFWVSNMRSHEKWREVMSRCPGIGKGDLFSKGEIIELLDLTFYPKTKR